MVNKRLELDIGDKVFLVFSDTRNRKMKDNIVLYMSVASIVINETGIIYTAKTEKVVLCGEEKLKKCSLYKSCYSFRGSNIDTGYSNEKYFYPVFTTKEKCIKYLKGE